MHRTIAVFLAALPLAAGCSDPKPPPRLASAPLTASDAPRAAAPPPRQDTASPTSGSVVIEDRILKACGDIPAAHFAFDSSKIDGDASIALTALARCFATGPLRGHSMKLIGHADPRGEVEYNLALGQRR